MYDLHPNSLILLSCNSISIASEATDRCENIATAALASGCESIIGFTRQIDFRPGIIRVLAGPQKCSTAAELIQALNSVLDFDSDGVAVCLGLTSHQFSTMKAMPYLNSNPVCSSHFPENPLKLVDVNNFHNELTRFIDINEMLKLICKKFALNNLISLIDLDTALILKARLFTHAISIKMAASESVSRNTSERYFRSQKILSEHFSDLCRGGLLSEIDTGAGVGDRLIPALRESRSRTLLSDFSICPQCAGIRRTWSLESLISSDTRFEAECSACGLHFNVPARSSINPGIQCDRMISIGDFLVIKLSILGMTREMQLNTSAYVQIRNKAEDEYLLNDSFTLLTLTSVGLSVKIPIGAKSDLHSIRIAWRNSQGTFLLRRLFITQSVNGESDD